MIGVSTIDFALDVRARMAGGGAVSLKPSLQYAALRTDRPDEGALIASGSGVTANGVTHYQESASVAAKTWWRHGACTRTDAWVRPWSLRSKLATVEPATSHNEA